MKQIEKHTGIQKIISVNNKLFIRGERFYSPNTEFISVDFELFETNTIVYRYNNDYIGIFSNKKEKFVRIYDNSNHILQSSTNENLILIFDNSSDYMMVYDLDINKMINKYDFGRDISIYHNNYVVVTEGVSYTKKNKISYWSLDKLQAVWSYTLPEGFKIFDQIQVIENMLFFTAVDKGFNNSKLIALDIVSGNKKWEIDDAIFYQIDIEKKLLLGYSIKRYEVVEPFLGKKIVQKNMMEYYDKGLSPVSTNNTIANGKLWFVSGRGKNVKFGYINIETSEIGLIQDFPLENDAQLDKPVYHNGQLYLLDSNNNLHIFEE